MSSSASWCWVRIGRNWKEDTYVTEKYVEYTDIKESFENIKTLVDLQNSIDTIQSDWDSPTACYFDINHSSTIFYVDQQGCISWAYDGTGVFIYGRKKMYVAKSLPEFLSHVYNENTEWYLLHE